MMLTRRLGPHWISTVAEWWRVWQWSLRYDGRWTWSTIRVGAAWSLLLGPLRVSNLRIRHVD